jgi:hypothetical protein
MSRRFLFYFGLVDRVCYASICDSGSRYRCLDVADMPCVLPVELSSEQPVCSYRHSNTHLPAHYKLTPISVVNELSKLLKKPHKSWRHGSATSVTRNCCGNRFSVRNRASTLPYNYEWQWGHVTACSLITKHTTKYIREHAGNIWRVGSITEHIWASCQTCCPNDAKHTFRLVTKRASSEQLSR